jgi:predicted amidohydrolase YtcJ
VTKALEPYAKAPTDLQIISALAGLRRMGIGSITGMISVTDAVWCAVDDEVATLVRLAPDLPIDIDVMLITRDPEQFLAAKERIDRSEGPIRFAGWKDFADGSLGGHTAAMYQPYADRPDTTGKVLHDHTRAMQMGSVSIESGGAVAIHAIGDRANDLVLDTMADLISEGAPPERLRIEHASVLTHPTIERMAALGVTASVQPAFLASEQTWLEKRLGPERMDRAYPFRSLAEAGVRLLGGSDSPVELPDPETGINAAVDRHGINVAETLTREQAEAMFSGRGYPVTANA